MSGFVERIGDAVAAQVSPDGSVHGPDLLLVEALGCDGADRQCDASSSEIAIAVPALEARSCTRALRNGLRTHVGFVRSGMAPRRFPISSRVTAVNSEWACPTAVWWGCLISVAPRLTSPWWRPSQFQDVSFQPVSAGTVPGFFR